MTTAYKNAPENTPIKDKFKRSLYSIHAEIDLRCLNSSQRGCNTTDFFGTHYIKKDGEFRAAYPWKKFEIKKGGH